MLQYYNDLFVLHINGYLHNIIYTDGATPKGFLFVICLQFL